MITPSNPWRCAVHVGLQISLTCVLYGGARSISGVDADLCDSVVIKLCNKICRINIRSIDDL